jgi:hypothetical protein
MLHSLLVKCLQGDRGENSERKAVLLAAEEGFQNVMAATTLLSKRRK